MKITSKQTGKTYEVNTGYRNGEKIVKFSGVTLTISGRTFQKYWMVTEN